MAKGRKGGGAKLNRSATVTMRLDLRLNYLCELAARINRQTKSSFLEMAAQKAVDSTSVRMGGESLGEVAIDLWDVDEPDRFVKLALRFPELLTYEEQILWKLLCKYRWYWNNKPEQTLENAHWVRIHHDWEALKSVAGGDALEEELYPNSDLAAALVASKDAVLFGTEEDQFEAQKEIAKEVGKILDQNGD